MLCLASTLDAQMPILFNNDMLAMVCMCWCSLSQSMVMQKKLRKAISYVARVQSFSLSGPAPKETMDCLLLKWFRTIPGVGSEVSVTMSMSTITITIVPL